MLTLPLGRTENRWEEMIWRNRKYRIGLAASRIVVSGNYMLRRTKLSENEVVGHEEEGGGGEEEKEEEK
jgi:hypothetical protein